MLKFTDCEEVGILGFRIYYGDGSTVTGKTKEDWEAAPLNDVQVVRVFYDRTYPCHEEGKVQTYNYVEQLHSLEYYWFSISGYGGAPRDPIPADAIIKHGKTCDSFSDIYNRSLQDRTWRSA